MDRSAQLNATLNSLALMNVAGIIKNNTRKVQTNSNKREKQKER